MVNNTPSGTKRKRDDDAATQEEQSSAKRVSDINDFNDIITVLVGENEERFIIHQDAICAKSKFFKAACSKSWREGQEKVVRLPEVKPATFKEYSRWIYAGDVAEPTRVVTSSAKEKEMERWSFTELYLLGDTLDDVLLRNQVLKLLFTSMRKHHELLSPDNLQLVYDSTPPSSLLRQMLVDVFLRKRSREHFDQLMPKVAREFLQELAVAALQKAPIENWDTLAEKLPQYLEWEQLLCSPRDTCH